jgi:hypothetical protein
MRAHLRSLMALHQHNVSLVRMRGVRVPRLALLGIAVLALFATTSGVAPLAGTAARIAPGGKMVVVKSGHWAKIAWTVSASDTADGHVCLYLVLPSLRAGAGSCGLVRSSPIRTGGSYGVAFTSGYQGVSYVIGAVPATARTVRITLWNGSVIMTRTITPPRGLASSIDFFAVEPTCRADEKAIVARDATGLTVARWTASRRWPASDC